MQLAVLVDALPPSSLAVLTLPAALPTVELTLHLAGALPPLGSWMLIDQCTVWASGDVVVDDGADLRDEHGQLIAQGGKPVGFSPL